MVDYAGYFLLSFFGIYYFIFIVCLIYFMIAEEWFCRNRLPGWWDKIKQNISRCYLYIISYKERCKYEKIIEFVPEIDFDVERLYDII